MKKFRALVNYEIEPAWEYYKTMSMPSWADGSMGDIIVKDLMWTGLKDKNGVDIYEGDIVNRTVNMANYCEGYGQVNEGNLEVFYSGIELLPFSEKGTNMEEYLVVGDIYKNGQDKPIAE